MQELLAQMTRPIVLSDRAARQAARINHARQDLARLNGREATTEALAEETGISQGQIGSLTAAARSARGLDEPQHSGDGDAATFGERLCDPSAEDAFDQIARQIEAEAVPHLLDALHDRERVLVRARYGLGGEQQTLREVGRTLSVSVERVRQLRSGPSRSSAQRPTRPRTCSYYLPTSRVGSSGRSSSCTPARYSQMSVIAIEPSPTADAIRLIEPLRTSPTAKIPGRLVSRNRGGRGGPSDEPGGSGATWPGEHEPGEGRGEVCPSHSVCGAPR